jgi:hypothetical protein
VTVKRGTPRTPKRQLVQLLDGTAWYWETVRVKHGKWHAMAKTMSRTRPLRASATNERQAMENLCKRLGVL